MKYKMGLVVLAVLVGSMVQAMQNGQAGEQKEEVDQDGVREWLLEGVEVVELEERGQSHIEALFTKKWHRNMLKEYAPDIVSAALAQLEHDADFQMLAHGQAALAHADSGSQPEGGEGSQALESRGAARDKTERVCMTKLLSVLAHAEKKVADDKCEQRWAMWHKTDRYILWFTCVTIPSLLVGGLWPVVRCGP